MLIMKLQLRKLDYTIPLASNCFNCNFSVSILTLFHHFHIV